MNTFRLLLAGLFLLCISVCRAQFFAHCTIYNEDNQKMTVYLDGERRNPEPATRVRIINLREPYFKLKIVFEDTSIAPVVRKMFPVQDTKGYPVDVVMLVSKNKKGEYGIHWKSQTVWPGYIKPDKTEAKAPPAAPKPAAPCAEATLAEPDLQAVTESIRTRGTEADKLLLARQVLTTNCVTTAQVKRVMQLFAEEENKLEVAKTAYAHTLDKGNYFRLNDEFKNGANIDELYRAITPR